jgi:hypothetical protein
VQLRAVELQPFAGKWKVTVEAVCGDVDTTVSAATEPPPLDSNSPEPVDAMCQGSTETAGAGFDTNGVGNVVADTFNPAPRLAETIAYEDQPYANDWTLNTEAICV